MTVLNHLQNPQTIVQKLPSNLQNKWRDLVTNMKKRSDKIASFEDPVEFFESAADSANDPIFGRDALQRTEERTRFSINTDHSEKPMSTNFATRVAPSPQP